MTGIKYTGQTLRRIPAIAGLLSLLLISGCQGEWSKGFTVSQIVDVGLRPVDVFYRDGQLFVAGGREGHVVLKYLETTGLGGPRELGDIDLGMGQMMDGKFQEGALFVRENIAGVACLNPGRLVVVDISDPANPRLAGEFKTKGNATDVWITPEKTAFVTTWSGVCHIVDLQDKFNVKSIADIPPPEGKYGDGTILPEKYATSVWVEGDTAYIVWWVHGRLAALDVSDPENPKMLGQYQTTVDKPRGGWAYRVFVSEDRAYLSADQFSKKVGGIHVVDISDLSRLKRLGFFSAKNYGKPEPVPRKFTRNLALIDSRLFVTDYKLGIVCLDVSKPEAIELIHQMEMLGLRGICAGENVLYAAGSEGVLVISPL